MQSTRDLYNISYASILIVDDQLESWRAMEPLLVGDEVHLVLAHGANEAVECLGKEEFALVLLCIQEADSSSLQTLKELRQMLGMGTPPIVLVISHDVSADYIKKAYATGAADFWISPYSEDILKAKVQVFLNLYRSSLEHRHTIAYLQDRLDERAVESRQLKSLFLANMSHELRTPLNVILGYAEILKEELDEKHSTHIEDAERIIVAGRQLLNLIDDVLDLSKIESGKMKLSLEEVNVGELLDEIATSVRGLAKQRNNALLVIMEGRIGLALLDPIKLRQILLNLINNACKFTENGTVRILCRPQMVGEQEWVIVEVHDTGIGIAEDDMNSLFQAFSQGDPTAARKFGGTGLGLVLSQMFANMMGGAITFTSKPGEGSTFVVSLPLNGSADKPV